MLEESQRLVLSIDIMLVVESDLTSRVHKLILVE